MRRVSLTVVMLTLLTAALLAVSTGNVFPGAGTSVDRAGATAWTNPGNIVSDNATDTTCAVPCDYLVASFDFDIPDSVVDGITVRAEVSETGTGNSNYVHQLHTNTTPTLIGNATGSITINGTTKVISTSGGASDLWGAVLTPTVVNTLGFGVSTWSTDATNTLAIDFITMSIDYSLPSTGAPSLNLIRFGGHFRQTRSSR